MSKAALEALVKTYAAEAADSTLRVNLLDPGPVRTAMRAKAMPGEDPLTLPPPFDITPVVLAMASAGYTANGELVVARDHPAFVPVTAVG